MMQLTSEPTTHTIVIQTDDVDFSIEDLFASQQLVTAKRNKTEEHAFLTCLSASFFYSDTII
jgi:hypothetical protein